MTEAITDITILVDDPEMIRLVVTWPKLSPKQRANESDVARAADIQADRIGAIVFRAKIHGLVKEDGSVNSFAERWISGMLGARLAEQVNKANKAKAKSASLS